MGRPSNLTEQKWEEIGKKLLRGEKQADLAREYGVSKTAISVRFSKRIETVKEVANQIVSTDLALSKLNVSEQIAAVSLADDLKAIYGHISSAARYSAATSNRLAGMAHMKSEMIEVSNGQLTEAEIDARKDVMMLQKMANESALIPMDLIKSNKDVIAQVNQPEVKKAKNLSDFYAKS